MKADPQEQRRLLDLQDVDNRIATNRRARTSVAARATLEKVESDVAATGPAFIAAAGAVEDTKAEILRLEDDVRLVDARMAQDVQRRDQSTSTKDIAGLEHEIATLNNRKEQLEESELVVMQRLEDAESELAGILATRELFNAEIVKVRNEIASIETQLDAELTNLAQARGTIVASVSDELLALYEKQRERYGVGAALLTRGISGGSNVALTATDLDNVRRAAEDDVILCPDSNCILIRNEESGL